jgi:hypothetical protein
MKRLFSGPEPGMSKARAFRLAWYGVGAAATALTNGYNAAALTSSNRARAVKVAAARTGEDGGRRKTER